MSGNLQRDVRAVVLTISDRCAAGTQVDRSGPAVVAMLREAGAAEVAAEVLPDEQGVIEAALRRLGGGGRFDCDDGGGRGWLRGM